MIRDSYSQPQDNAPYTPAYDMDIDIPIPEDEPDNGAIVSPEELMQDPPELFTPDAETAPAETAAPAAPASEPVSQPPARPYQIPSIDFLQNGVSRAGDPAVDQEMKEKAGILVETLKSFGVTVRITGIFRGPSVTRYEIQPAAGIKVSKITGLADDIALSLAAQGVRIEAPIPGKPAIGIEVPNSHKDTVSLREILESDSFRSSRSKLAFAVGRDIAGNAVVGDIARLPHMIIAGATGSGKSVCTNSIIMSILYHATPEEVKLILIDPKIVEFTVYEGIPHLLIPVVTDPKKAAGALNWAVQEMQRRYNLFAENSVRDLGDYNAAAAQPGSGLEPMPQIVVIIDELADLMMTTSKEVEDSICRLAQKARAAGMHLIIATQRPTTDIITGLIKANIPSRYRPVGHVPGGLPYHPGHRRRRKAAGSRRYAVLTQRKDQAGPCPGLFHLHQGDRKSGGLHQVPDPERIQRRNHGTGGTEHPRHQGRGKGTACRRKSGCRQRAGTGQR